MNVDFFFRGFVSELRKISAEARSAEQIAKGKSANIKVPENREPPEETPRNAGAAA